MRNHDRARVERRQPSKMRLVAFDRDNGNAAYDKCANRIDDASAGIVEPPQKRIARRDARAHDVRCEAEGQRQGDGERWKETLMIDVARRATEPAKQAEKLGAGIA